MKLILAAVLLPLLATAAILPETVGPSHRNATVPLASSVAKRHGGRAWAESEGPGHGSTFVLQLPIAR